MRRKYLHSGRQQKQQKIMTRKITKREEATERTNEPPKRVWYQHVLSLGAKEKNYITYGGHGQTGGKCTFETLILLCRATRLKDLYKSDCCFFTRNAVVLVLLYQKPFEVVIL